MWSGLSARAETLGTDVVIKHSVDGKGKLVVSYNSLDEIDSILARLYNESTFRLDDCFGCNVWPSIGSLYDTRRGCDGAMHGAR